MDHLAFYKNLNSSYISVYTIQNGSEINKVYSLLHFNLTSQEKGFSLQNILLPYMYTYN